MRTLQPLVEDATVVTHNGRLPVQLEIPPESTLCENDIRRILELSSWDERTRDFPTSYPGGRCALIPRERAIEKGGVPLPALQVNGTGYKRMEWGEEGVFLVRSGDSFVPPSAQNFIDMIPEEVMRTAFYQGSRRAPISPGYRPLGAYSATELEHTVKNTRIVAGLPLKSVVVPHVEAYGRYLSPELRAEDGPFGFVVLPSPSPRKERCFTELGDMLDPQKNGHLEIVEAFFSTVLPPVARCARGLREAHAHGVVHLQPHLSNFYSFEGAAYLVDWTTMRPLDGDAQQNLLNRALDIYVLAQNCATRMRATYERMNDLERGVLLLNGMFLLSEAYRGTPLSDSERNITRVVERAKSIYGSACGDVEVIATLITSQHAPIAYAALIGSAR